ncbi:MAG: hypothetical protein EA350_17060 [Gemmatimonadales bacterium]|nr:MAG: hypothetical protein EA350_17060 [Gemmatimonadales bacterium]
MRANSSAPSVLPILVLLFLAGCGGEAPALEVDGAAFFPDVVAPLSEEQVDLLAALAAVGSGAATGDWRTLGAPRLAAAERARLVERLRDEIMLEGAGITEGELEERYAAAPQYELEVRHLVVLSERWQPAAVREEARTRAESGLQRIQAGEPFAEVAAEVSEEPGAAARGGLLRPGRRGTWVAEFWEAASRLVEGGVSPVVETPYGFHVLRLEARRTLPFSEARPAVVQAVARSLGGGAAWEEARIRWISDVEILDPTGALGSVHAGDPDGTDGPPRPSRPSVAAFAAGGRESLEDPDALVARWPGGGLSAEDLRMHLLSLPAGRLRSLLDPGGSAELEVEIRRAAEARVLVEQAGERGIRPTESDGEAELREWEAQAAEWVGLLGFAPGADAETRRDRALAAMRATGQNARIARSAVAEAAPTLLSGVSVTGTAVGAGTP